MQRELIDLNELASRLGVQPGSIIAASSRNASNRPPEPDGRVAEMLYWVRGPLEA